MKALPFALAACAVLISSAATARGRVHLVCPDRPVAMRYNPALAESAYDAAVNTAATERRAYDDTYYTATREARWQQMRAGGRPATYDAIYGPGAYAQNYKLSSFGYYAP